MVNEIKSQQREDHQIREAGLSDVDDADDDEKCGESQKNYSLKANLKTRVVIKIRLTGKTTLA